MEELNFKGEELKGFKEFNKGGYEGKILLYKPEILLKRFEPFIMLFLNMDNKKYNGMMERINRIGTSKERRKKYKHIVEELGARGITLNDISDENFNGKSRGFIDMIKKEKKTVIMITHDIAEAISLSDKIIVLSKRPSIVKKIYDIKMENKSTPINNRTCKEFSDYYDKIWRDLDEI